MSIRKLSNTPHFIFLRMSEPQDENKKELLEEKVEELVSEVKGLSEDLEEKKK